MNKDDITLCLRAALPVCALSLAVPALFGQVKSEVSTSVKSIITLVQDAAPALDLVERREIAGALPHAPENVHQFSAVRAGERAEAERLTLRFSASTKLTKITPSKDFAVEDGSGCVPGKVFAKDETCVLYVRFKPEGPGRRVGKLSIENSASATPEFVGLSGYGYAPTLSFTPSVMSTVSATGNATIGLLSGTTNLTVDGGDILYIPDTGHNQIRQLDSSGTISNITPVFGTPQTLAVDAFGIIYSMNATGSTYYFSYVYPFGSQSNWNTTYAPGACMPSNPCPLDTVGLSSPASIGVDPYNNLFFAEGTKGAAEMPVGSVSGSGTVPSLWYLTDRYVYPDGEPSLAVDGSDNIYTFYHYGSNVCYIVSEALGGAENGSPTAVRAVGGSKCGFSGDGGVAPNAEIGNAVGQITFDLPETSTSPIRRTSACGGSTIAPDRSTPSPATAPPATPATAARA